MRVSRAIVSRTFATERGRACEQEYGAIAAERGLSVHCRMSMNLQKRLQDRKEQSLTSINDRQPAT